MNKKEKQILEKQLQEKELIAFMIGLYCKRNHKGKELCSECEELLEYANQRIEGCRHKEDKTFCSVCPNHCYKPSMREQIKVIMRWSGPRLIFYRPVQSIRHIIETLKHKRKGARNGNTK